jgi:prepilin-type N-terminal cleavage/methylation domain-containing protein
MLTMRRGQRAIRLARGFSLIEMMVAIVIGMIVAAGAVSLIVAIDRANSETIQAARINQELRALASVIGDEIKRARRLHDPVAGVGQGSATNGTFDFVDTSTAGCIVYGYQDATLNDDTAAASAAVSNFSAIYLDANSNIVLARDTSPVTCTTAGTILNSSQLKVVANGLTFRCVTTNGTSVSDVANTTAADTTQVQETCNQIDMVLSAKLTSGDPYTNSITHTYVQQVFIRSGAVKTS